jgi:hypothetical protein
MSEASARVLTDRPAEPLMGTSRHGRPPRKHHLTYDSLAADIPISVDPTYDMRMLPSTSVKTVQNGYTYAGGHWGDRHQNLLTV